MGFQLQLCSRMLDKSYSFSRPLSPHEFWWVTNWNYNCWQIGNCFLKLCVILRPPLYAMKSPECCECLVSNVCHGPVGMRASLRVFHVFSGFLMYCFLGLKCFPSLFNFLPMHLSYQFYLNLFKTEIQKTDHWLKNCVPCAVLSFPYCLVILDKKYYFKSQI